MNIRELRLWGLAELRANSHGPSCEKGDENVLGLEVDLLLCHVLGFGREALIARRDEKVSEDERAFFEDLISRRKRSEPISYIIGKREFFGREFEVSPAVLIPRPETEMLVECSLDSLEDSRWPFVFLDLGTGSGNVILSVASELRERHRGSFAKGMWLGTDKSIAALRVARCNAGLMGLDEEVGFAACDLLSGIDLRGERKWVIVANLPYVPDDDLLMDDVARYEPASALRGGSAGLSVISRFVSELAEKRPSKCSVFLEIGQGQFDAVECLALSHGCVNVRCRRDLSAVCRVVSFDYGENV